MRIGSDLSPIVLEKMACFCEMQCLEAVCLARPLAQVVAGFVLTI
jgi:hypothetical protein